MVEDDSYHFPKQPIQMMYFRRNIYCKRWILRHPAGKTATSRPGIPHVHCQSSSGAVLSSPGRARSTVGRQSRRPSISDRCVQSSATCPRTRAAPRRTERHERRLASYYQTTPRREGRDDHRTDAGEWEVNFNEAYDPTCAYANRYDCPLPAAENRLDVRIEAGEKTFQ